MPSNEQLPVTAQVIAQTLDFSVVELGSVSERNHRDAMLVSRMANGDELALRRLYDLYLPTLLRLAHAVIREPSDVEEVVSDAMHKAWNDAASFDARRGSVIAWLTVLTKSKARDLARARKRRYLSQERAWAESVAAADFGTLCATMLWEPAAHVETEELHASVALAVQQLPTEQREVTELSLWHNASHSTIAAQLNVPLGTVKTRARLALQKLRATLRERDLR